MSEKTDRLKQRLANSRAYLNQVLDQVGDRWETRIYEDGEQWNAREVLVHVADAERGQLKTAMAIANGQNPIPPDFDINRYNQRIRSKQADVTPEMARASLAETREALLAWIDTLDDDVLAREGRHASLYIFTVEQYIKIMSNHERDHARDMADVLNIPTKQE
jgi:hypothetical protein